MPDFEPCSILFNASSALRLNRSAMARMRSGLKVPNKEIAMLEKMSCLNRVESLKPSVSIYAT